MYLRIAPVLAFLLAGCATIDASEKTSDNRTSAIYFGITEVITPQTKGAISAIDVSTLGFGWDRGPFLGWHRGSWIEADPAKCQLVVIIRSPAQAENAARVLQALEGQTPCIADFTGGSGEATP